MKSRYWILLLCLLSVTALFADVEAQLHTEYSYWGQFFKMIITLGAFVALIVGLAWLYRKFGLRRALFGNSYSKIQIMERRPLSPKSTLYLIEVEEQRYLIGDSPGGLRCLAILDQQNRPVQMSSRSAEFEEILEKKLK